ncbi:DUF2167 domain-containing protein [Niveibacterium microcysteis]|uniref:DUF2167 domain-containing protein n=1 Tax=Niveibacterium microcysteis TaxID=2811415 RepID=A0ABX7MA28_9RHOO|nr:DUF2167 domain-containing protein [Niveibacterium microcysteis]QSI77593.1 DUF2167 domain-containing protein [Niveibacterium microcysteis]
MIAFARRALSCLSVCSMLLCAGPSSAEEAQVAARQAEMSAAVQAAEAVKVVGPAEVKLLDQATLKLPAGRIWVPQPAAGNLMHAMGNSADDRLAGVIFPDGEGDWLVVAEFEKAGYIKDDDARDWKADELLENIKQGTAASNEDRRARGIPELDVLGWVQAPTYDAATHRLVWSIRARQKGQPESAEGSINYNTYALGRDGYFSLNLVTGADRIAQDKPVAHALLAALEYGDGKRYSDFNASTDKVAEYGLAALVGGLAVKKLGLFAVIAAFAAKSFKLIALGGVALVAAARRLFGGRKAQQDDASV